MIRKCTEVLLSAAGYKYINPLQCSLLNDEGHINQSCHETSPASELTQCFRRFLSFFP
jgi:hypothetical protein